MSTATLRLAINAKSAVAGSREFGRAADHVRRKGRQADAAVAGVGKRMNAMGGVASRLREQIVTLAAAFIGLQAIRKVTTLLAEFEQTMLTVQAVTKATPDQFRQLTETAREMGATTRFTAAQAGDALLILSRAGFSANEAMAALKPTLDLAVAGAIGLADAADIAASAVRQFGLAADEAGRVADVLLAITNRTNQNVTELGEAMKYAGPAAAAAGLSIEQTAAAIGVLSNAGIKASMAGTNVRGSMLKLAQAATPARAALESMGLSMEDVDPTAQTLVELFGKLNKGLLTFSRAGAIFGRRNAGAALVLAQNVDLLEQLTEGLEEVEGEAADMAATMDSGLVGTFKALISASEEVILQMGDSGLGKALQDTLELAVGVMRSFGGVAHGMGEASEEIQRITAVVKGLAGAIGAVVGAGLVKWVAQLAVTSVANPFMLLAAGVGALVYNLNALETPLQRSIEQIDRLRKAAHDLQPGSAGIADVTAQLDFVDAKLQALFAEQKAVSAHISRESQDFFGVLRNQFRPMDGDLQGQSALGRFDDIQKEIRQFEELQRDLSATREKLVADFRALQTADLPDVPHGQLGAEVTDFMDRLNAGPQSQIAQQAAAEVQKLMVAFDAIAEGPLRQLNAEIQRLEAGLEHVTESDARAKIEGLIENAKARVAAIRAERATFAEVGQTEAESAFTRQALVDLEQQYFDSLTLRMQAVGKTRAEVEKLNAVEDARRTLTAAGITDTDMQAAFLDQLAGKYDKLALAESRAVEIAEFAKQQMEDQQETIRAIEQTFRSFGSAVADAFTEFVTGAKTAKDAARQLLDTISKQAISAGFNALFGAAFGGLGSAVGGAVASANGNVFAGGRLVPFARGGVVGSPTIFPMANGGVGLMGEAGPEAIMPLERGPDGKLGVRSGGGGAPHSQRPIVVNIQARDVADFRRSKRQVVSEMRKTLRDAED